MPKNLKIDKGVLKIDRLQKIMEEYPDLNKPQLEIDLCVLNL